jgi:hypothetical protein
MNPWMSVDQWSQIRITLIRSISRIRIRIKVNDRIRGEVTRIRNPKYIMYWQTWHKNRRYKVLQDDRTLIEHAIG